MLCFLKKNIRSSDTFIMDFADANSGPSDDWAKGVAGVQYTYTIELRDQGPVYGFLLPPE